VIRPTARLNFKIRKEELNDALVTDIKRCYLNVAPVTIEEIEDAEGQPAADTLQLAVVLHSPYWHQGEEADETWTSTLLPWLEKKLYKLGATVVNYNKTRLGEGQPLYFKALEIAMNEHIFSFELPEDTTFPKEILSLLGRCRDLANEGPLKGLEFVRVDMPWRDPHRSEALEASVTDDAAASEAPDDACGDPASGEPIGCTVWGVHFADGSSRRLDAAGGMWA